MLRKFKLVIYSVILTWFAVILIENWHYMRLSWFKEVWEFIDFRAIGYYIDEYLSICVVFGAGIIILYRAITDSVRSEKNEVPSDHSDEADISSENYMAELQAKWHADARLSPRYSYRFDNAWYRDFHRRKSDHH